MPSEYDALFSGHRASDDDLEPVRERFRAAGRPYLRSPVSWLAWAVLLPTAALVTPRAFQRGGPVGVLIAWAVVILVGGAVELTSIVRSGRGARGTPLAAWALRVQGNLSLVALALSILLVWQDLAWALPGVWLLLLGHSFYLLGGIAFEPFRVCGIIYQIGGVVAFWPGGSPLGVFAAATALGNLWVAYGVWRGRGETA